MHTVFSWLMKPSSRSVKDAPVRLPNHTMVQWRMETTLNEKKKQIHFSLSETNPFSYHPFVHCFLPCIWTSKINQKIFSLLLTTIVWMLIQVAVFKILSIQPNAWSFLAFSAVKVINKKKKRSNKQPWQKVSLRNCK
jgi:hypothetical protein